MRYPAKCRSESQVLTSCNPTTAINSLYGFGKSLLCSLAFHISRTRAILASLTRALWGSSASQVLHSNIKTIMHRFHRASALFQHLTFSLVSPHARNVQVSGVFMHSSLEMTCFYVARPGLAADFYLTPEEPWSGKTVMDERITCFEWSLSSWSFYYFSEGIASMNITEFALLCFWERNICVQSAETAMQ